MQLHINDFNQTVSDSLKVSSFVVVPQHSFHRMHMHIDKIVAGEVYNLTATRGYFLRKQMSKADIFQQCFNLQDMQDTFSYAVKTNGVKLSLLMNVPTQQEIPDQFADYQRNHDNNVYRRYVGIDAGGKKSEMCTIIDLDDGLDKETFAYFEPRHYYEFIQHAQYMKKISKMTEPFTQTEANDQIRIESHFGQRPSKTSSEFILYIGHKLRMFKQGVATWMEKDISMLEFNQYQQKEAFLKQFCREIHQGKRTIVHIGENPIHRSSPVKGYPRVPLTELIRAMKDDPLIDVVIGDEFNTTQKCPCCFNQMQFFTNRQKRNIFCVKCTTTNDILPQPNQGRTLKMIFGPKDVPYKNIQQKTGQRNCHWDRDKSASRNMVYLLFCKLRNVQPNHVFIRGD